MSKLRSVAGRAKREVDAFRVRTFVQPVLANRNPTETRLAESDFDALQAAYPPLPEYGYDSVSLARRAAGRVSDVLAHAAASDTALSVLDVGAGDGTFGALLAAAGHAAYLCDQRDWRAEPARGVAFAEADCCVALPYDDDRFDIVASFNSVEHMPNPERAFDEMIRVTRPGGLIHLDFGPLYFSPWGLHAYRSLRMPYPQLLFSEEFVSAKLLALGISDLGESRDVLQYVNGWKPSDYDALWNRPELERVFFHVDRETHWAEIATRYPKSFQGRGLTWDDLTACQVKAVFRKRPVQTVA